MAAVNPTSYDPKNPTGVASSTQNTTTYNNGVTVRNRDTSGVGVTPVGTRNTDYNLTLLGNSGSGFTATSTSPYTTTYTNGAGNNISVRNRNPDVPSTTTTTTTTTTDDINPPGTTTTSYGRGGYGSGRGSGSSSGGGGGGSYTAPILPSATDQSAYINAMYAANEQAARDNLRAEYENNLAQLDYQQGRLPETYNAAVDQANAQSTINRLNFNEAAAANGLNTGAGSQARLSQNNALLSNVSAIRKAQADAQAELDLQRTQMEAQYQQAIREAVAKNDLEKAQALYQEAKRVDESIVNTAINQANLNWNVWRALYG